MKSCSKWAATVTATIPSRNVYGRSEAHNAFLTSRSTARRRFRTRQTRARVPLSVIGLLFSWLSDQPGRAVCTALGAARKHARGVARPIVLDVAPVAHPPGGRGQRSARIDETVHSAVFLSRTASAHSNAPRAESVGSSWTAFQILFMAASSFLASSSVILGVSS